MNKLSFKKYLLRLSPIRNPVRLILLIPIEVYQHELLTPYYEKTHYKDIWMGASICMEKPDWWAFPLDGPFHWMGLSTGSLRTQTLPAVACRKRSQAIPLPENFSENLEYLYRYSSFLISIGMIRKSLYHLLTFAAPFAYYSQELLLQSNFSTTATLGTEESGRCRELVVMGR